MDLRLSEPASIVRPSFSTALGCVEWLQTLPLINVAPSQGRLLEELRILNTLELVAEERMRILESLLDAAVFLQSEHARKFAGRAVPLARPEREVLQAVVDLWTELADGYRHCLESKKNHPSGKARQKAALALHRSIWCTSHALREFHKCYLEPPKGLWSKLVESYTIAERLSIATEPVPNPIRKGLTPTRCMNAVSEAILMATSSPNEMTSRQIEVTSRWLDRWSAKVILAETFVPDPEANASREFIAINLDDDNGPARYATNPPQGSMRLVDARTLSASLRTRVTRLRKGESPAVLGLGDDVPPQFAEALLLHLHRLWCEGRRPRAQSRQSGSECCLVATGMASIHFQLTGHAFQQPVESAELSKIQHDEIATFGRVSTRQEVSPLQQSAVEPENWNIIDESPAGLRIARISGDSRLTHTQLVAVKPGNSAAFLLGSIRWLAVDRNNVARIGLRLLPGVPSGISIRAAGANARREKYVPALSLPAVRALSSPDSLVLPAGWFKPLRVIQVHSDTAREVRLTGVLDRGSDFERVAFEEA